MFWVKNEEGSKTYSEAVREGKTFLEEVLRNKLRSKSKRIMKGSDKLELFSRIERDILAMG